MTGTPGAVWYKTALTWPVYGPSRPKSVNSTITRFASATGGLPSVREKEKGPADMVRWAFAVGGANRDRTGDLYNAIVALSQLSYGPGAGRPAKLGTPGDRGKRKLWSPPGPVVPEEARTSVPSRTDDSLFRSRPGLTSGPSAHGLDPWASTGYQA